MQADEPVAHYDADANPIGVVQRSVAYRDGLWHASTAVLVRSGGTAAGGAGGVGKHSDGERVYLHRRSPEKMIFPGLYDCWAGGVLGPGENPGEAAERELAEELGVVGAPLRPLGRHPYDDGRYRYHVFGYEVRWDGPVRHQPEEVVWGDWVTVDELRAVLADPRRWPFVPDGRELAGIWIKS
ncbi:NUDIX domain-containing protein [Pseudonocardia aurantiaca]|uniref:NUDIX domain-containing protein n=1 Tax=Pseudonocardia aurantiaca TaxID=75290 RepID=A0ABW4FF65_9PSEU